jgi:hypothetical protein
MFAALFSKIWRINKIFKNPHPYTRMKVTNRDLYVPLLSLLGLNVINLAVWTAVEPLEFTRQNHMGTDGWNRYISYYGTCSSPDATPFIVLLALINVSAVILANWQAYQARSIQSEFAESKYIAIAMVVVLQALLTGVPILFLVRDDPQVYYVVIAIMFFVISVAILLLVFVPKIFAEQRYAAAMDKQKKQHVNDSMAQLKEKRYRFGSLFANDGSKVDEAEEAMANRRDFGSQKNKKRDLAQDTLDEDESNPHLKRRFRRKWPRQDMSFKDNEEGMILERGDFDEPCSSMDLPRPTRKAAADREAAPEPSDHSTMASHIDNTTAGIPSVDTPPIPGSVHISPAATTATTTTATTNRSHPKKLPHASHLVVGIGPSFAEQGPLAEEDEEIYEEKSAV